MTKAEIKKMETERKYDFISNVYNTILQSIPLETRGHRKKFEVRIVHQNYNRYVRFHSYGQDMAFQIFGDGNIAIEMKEACHSNHVEQLFEYDTDIEKQNAFIKELSEMARCLIRVFIGSDFESFHTYMDYVSDEQKTFAESVIELDCDGTMFSAKGKTVLQEGWKTLVRKNSSTKLDEQEQVLPNVSVGDKLNVIGTEIKEGKTSPPKHFTEDTLLSAMETAGADEIPEEAERKGLGTPATRAGIIEKLVQKGFLERKGDKKTKHLIPTHKGTALVTVMPEQVQSPSMTADWEEKLLLIEQGEYSGEDFMEEIKNMIAGLVQNYEVIRDSEVLMAKEKNSIGTCPICGSAVEDKAKAFFCSNRNCKFALWKNNRYFESIGKNMNASTAQKLLTAGKVKLKGCKSKKTGKSPFSTSLRIASLRSMMNLTSK